MGKFKQGKATFINPYNFVNVNWKKTDRTDISKSVGEITGVIHCKLHVVTPICVPDTENVDVEIINHVMSDGQKKEHKKYPFMRSPDGQYMIPGSSLRGAIRSVYETVTDSCFVTSDEKQVITRRAGMRECGKPYLLSKNGDTWELCEAERYLIIIDDNNYTPLNKDPFNSYVSWNATELGKHRYGERILFTPGATYFSQKHNIALGNVVRSFPGKMVGYLYKGEVPPKSSKIRTNKHFESIFVKLDKDAIPISEDQVDELRVLYKEYNNNSINRLLSAEKPDFYREVLDLLNHPNQPIPVWYNVNNHHLSLAAIGRIAYKNRMGDIISSKKPCSDREHLCKACQLFGAANKKAKVGSRIHITDAVPSGKISVIPNVTIKELGNPRISFEKFYVNGKSYDKGGLPRGRKYYWHNEQKDAYRVNSGLTNQGKTQRNATVELVDAKSEFSFDVYFDRITDDQLAELKWVLTLGQNTPTSSLCYRIGRGKPIGLGSVKISIESIQKRTCDIARSSYILTPEKLGKEVIPPETFSQDAVQEILTILNTKTTQGRTVSYPFIEDAKENDNDTAPHNWFSELKDPKSVANQQEWKPISTAASDPFFALERINDRIAQDNRQNSGTKKNQARKYEAGKKYKGKVCGANDSGTVLKVSLNDGGIARVHFRDIKVKKYHTEKCLKRSQMVQM